MTPAMYIRGLIVDNIHLFNDLDIEHVHTFMIDKDDISNDKPIIVIKEPPVKSRTYGNSEPISELRTIQIDFYYPKDYMGDMEGLEHKIESFLFMHNITETTNAGHAIVPATENITNTIKFNYIKELDING